MHDALVLHGHGEHLSVLLFGGQTDDFIQVAESAPIVAGLDAVASPLRYAERAGLSMAETRPHPQC